MQTGPLSDSDILGLKESLLEIGIEFLVYGIYSALAMIVLCNLWTNKALSTARRILIAAAISMFVANMAQISIDLASSLIQLPTVGFDPPNVERPLIYMKILGNTMIRLNFLIGDSIVVWRAWVIWTHHSKVHALLLFCLVGSFDTPKFPPTGSRILILILPLFLTNFVSTLSMGYKVWEYKVEIKQNLGLPQNKRTKVERVLILLTESGSIYCLLWLSMPVFGLESSNDQSLSYGFIAIILPQLVAIYPFIIILLVALEKTNLESTVTGPSFSQSIQFSSRPQVPTVTHSDVPPDSTTSHLASVRPDPNRDGVSDSGTDVATVALSVKH
ncbi:hypothetical protein C8J56DRAFT_1131723 [Mycena floridula]|nr:hypothetical protein C8J56DRAFT_1131723 [Mycena floridula]